MAMFCENCGLDEPINTLCSVCAEVAKQNDQKTLDALKRCRESKDVVESKLLDKNLIESLRRIKGQLESTARQADRTAREIEELLDTD